MSKPRGGASSRILVVDDEPNVVIYLEMLLQDEGYETDSAENGREAMEKVAAIRPDLICLDITMPKETGARFYQKLMSDSELADIPVLVVTATMGTAGQDDPFREFLNSHKEIPSPGGFLSKPIDRDVFLGKVRELLS